MDLFAADAYQCYQTSTQMKAHLSGCNDAGTNHAQALVCKKGVTPAGKNHGQSMVRASGSHEE